MNREIRDPIDAGQQIDVSRDQRTLGDDHHTQSWVLGQYLEDPARDSESSLCRLIWICRGADHDRLAVEQLEMPVASKSESATQYLGCVSFDEDVALECEPGRHLVICFAECGGHFFVGRGALHHVAVGVARVAVRAPEGAADVGVD